MFRMLSLVAATTIIWTVFEAFLGLTLLKSQTITIAAMPFSSQDLATTSKMQRAIVYGSPKVDRNYSHDIQSTSLKVSWLQKKVPLVKSGQVLIKVVCAGLNPVDAKNVIGDKLPHSWTYLQQLYHDNLLAGCTIGFDFSGIVEDCPGGSFQPGDEVFGTMPPFQGTLAEFIAAPLHQVHYKSQQHSFAEAAALPLVGLTDLQALSPFIKKRNEGAIGPTSSVLIIGGSGGAGHVACQVARNLGATHVTTICSSHHADFCKEKGATYVVDYHMSSSDLVKALQAAPGCIFAEEW